MMGLGSKFVHLSVVPQSSSSTQSPKSVSFQKWLVSPSLEDQVDCFSSFLFIFLLLRTTLYFLMQKYFLQRILLGVT